MAKKKPRRRRSFTPEFRAEIVELCRRGDRSISEVAKNFDPTETSVRQWARQAEIDADERNELTTTSLVSAKAEQAHRPRRTPTSAEVRHREAPERQ
ncbi:transposase [Spongiactinospora sp. 9N601]|uniref:transposase n=1 Tax=Spongiactinospora sp. 9N601 TaxID=3375149 RepID=UPI00378D815D